MALPNQRIWDAGVPHCGREPIRDVIVFGAKESIMVERRRKQAHSRKTVGRKLTRKTGRTKARRSGPIRKKTSAKKVSKKTSTRKSSTKKSAAKPSPKRWSQRVTRESDALDLRHGVFKLTDPKKIAASLKRSAEHSSRRKRPQIMPRAGGNQLRRTKWGPFKLDGCAALVVAGVAPDQGDAARDRRGCAAVFRHLRVTGRSQGGTVLR
jgi:uncharacterized protein DUF3175